MKGKMAFIKITAFPLALLAILSTVTGESSKKKDGENSTFSQHYELLCDMKATETIPVQKFRSRRTGLTITLAKIEGPLVSGYFTLATEAHDNDGLPHTLEHLVFMGSEDYPFKGVLDLLANRCLASGTNAWTARDHTAYTLETAGSEGFLNILPVYLDHILYPTLLNSSFITEIHHINGEGEDAGVVYSEIQGRQNSEYDLMDMAVKNAVYPAPSGYRSATGGALQNLRESTNNEKIRKYHKKLYRPENLNLIIMGMVEPEDIFAAIESTEQKILSKGDRPPFTKPWQSPVPPLKASVDELVEYPSDSEETGVVVMAWRGPPSVKDINELTSMRVLMKYLTHSSVSPLTQTFVEIDDPLASSVSYSCLSYSASSCAFYFNGVPKDKIDEVKPLLMETLAQLTDKEVPIDMDDLKDILENKILRLDSTLEESPHSIAYSIIGNTIYGDSCKDLDLRLNKRDWYQSLKEKSDNYWMNLIKTYMLGTPSVVIRGIPSIAEAKRLEEEEKTRLELRREVLGEEQLMMLEEELKAARMANEELPPDEMIQSVPVPGVSNIQYHSLETNNNYVNLDSVLGTAQPDNDISKALEELPIKFQLDDVRSNFVTLVAILDTSTVNPLHRPYLTLLLDILLESTLARDNGTIPYEEVVRELFADTLSRNAYLGVGLYGSRFYVGSFGSYACVRLKVEMDKYEKGVKWLQEILFKTLFTEERIKVKAKKLINSIGEYKRMDTNQNQQSILRQEKFLSSLLQRLDSEEEEVLKEIEEVRNTIVQPDRITIHMATDLDKLSKHTDPVAPWANFVSVNGPPTEKLLNVIPDSQLLSRKYSKIVTGFATGIGSVESGYLMQSTRCISDHRDWDVPAVLTAIQYLTQLEGPMFREIRGKGLAYSSGIRLDLDQGTLVLSLYRASQLIDAYGEARNIILSHINGTATWDKNLLESAQSSLMYKIINREDVVESVIRQSLLSYYRRIHHSHNKDFVDRISAVTIEDVKRAALKYFVPLILPETSDTMIVCPPSKVQEISDEMNRFGQNIEVIESMEDSRFG